MFPGKPGMHVLFANPTGGGGGGEGDDDPPDDNGEGDGDDTDPTDDTDQAPDGYLSQEKVDKIVQDRLDRERKKWEEEAERKRKEAERKAEEERLQQQEEYKELAEQRQERITQLEVQVGEIPGYKERIEQLEGVVEGYVERLREGLPEYVVELLDGRDYVEQLEWLNNHAEDLDIEDRTKLPPGRKPRGGGEMDDDEKRKKAVSVRNLW
jgi:hypothetical protein